MRCINNARAHNELWQRWCRLGYVVHKKYRIFNAQSTTGIKNPISAALAILDNSSKPDKLGRIPPLTLVSSGAHSFASSHGVQTVHPDEMVTALARDQWIKWMSRLESHDHDSAPEPDETLRDIQDTVGAVAFHETDGMSAGVSRCVSFCRSRVSECRESNKL